jgi:isoleucyl-tRNA synthetase
MTRKEGPNKKNERPIFLEGDFNLPHLEEKVLQFWKNDKIFERSLAEHEPKGKSGKGKKFVFYEGPPYANGKPAIHHVLARVVKDVMLRYKTMRGYFVPRKAGWDTHGLPVEMATEKVLGLKSKRDIEKYGIKLFNEKAKEQVWLYREEWGRLTERIGYWLDLKNAYVTYAPEYIETIWWTLAQIYKRKLLYKGFKVVPWCTRCGTALSSHELALGYQEVVDNSVYVKFKLTKGQMVSNFVADDNTYILSWTTTPWTLPGNVALAVGEDIPYVLLRTVAPDRASYIVAKDLASTIFKDSDFAVMGEFPGRRLVGLAYEPLFDIAPLRSEQSYRVHSAGFVTTTDGTGVVHTAVMYGEDDYALGKKIGLPEHHTVDEEGKFTKDVSGFAGDYVKAKETEDKIFNYLGDRGYLFKKESYMHEYPHCWRCGTPILYYARTSWFIGMSKLRESLLKRNKKINWMPAHVKDGRFGEWLREAKDWNLSRERFWGAPLPIWECKDCGHTEVVGSLDELSRLAEGPSNKYWAIRHGESFGVAFGGIIDSGNQNFHLTEPGKKQLEQAANRLKAQHFDLIFASDLTRTKESAAILAKGLGVKKITYDKRLREINLGRLSGMPSTEYWKLMHDDERFSEHVVQGAESLREVRTRAWAFLKDMEEKHHGKNILIVSHEDTIWMLAEIAAGWTEEKAAAKKTKHDGFLKPAQAIVLNLKTVPRDDTGLVDLHRPFTDDIFLRCPKCGPKKMRRVKEVADVWYDSGAMPLAQAHFPFSVDEKILKSAAAKPQAHIAYPADYIAEGMDQTRGWFYTMLAIATALGYEAPYKNVITFGLMNDKFGKKMSKSKGNVIEPFAMIDKYGADAVRWYFYSGTPFGEPKNFDEAEIAKAFRKTHLIVYNSFVFWNTYAGAAPVGSLKNPKNVLDKWILARLAALTASITKKLDRYEIREASLEIENFVDGLSRWYIRRSRRRLQRQGDMKDYEVASATLGHVLLSLVTLMAPFTPFFSEALYAELRGSKVSVHLDAWPKADKKAVNTKLLEAMEIVRQLAAQGLAARAEAGVKVRQPLASLSIGRELDKDLEKILADEVNVKKIILNAKLKDGVELDTKLTPELKEEGTLREIARTIQELRQKAALEPQDKIMLVLALPASMKDIVLKHEGALRSDVGAKSVEYGRSDKFTAEIATTLEGQEAWIGIRKI